MRAEAAAFHTALAPDRIDALPCTMITAPGSIDQLLIAYREGRDSPTQVARRVLAYAERHHDTQRIFIRLLENRALARALIAERMLQGSTPLIQGHPLAGIPVALKDNIDVADVPTSVGGIAPRPNAPANAWIVARLDELGAMILGKTHLDEAALGASGRNQRYGRCINPRFPACLSGGSSSGSAAAVASGQVLLGIGTDTLGSVRIPAALCGIAGFKPTPAVFSRRGVEPLHAGFDAIGLLAHSIADINASFTALTGTAPMSAAADAPNRPQIPWQRAPLKLAYVALAGLSVDDHVVAAYEDCIDRLRGRADIELQPLPPFDFYGVARAALWEVVDRFRSRPGFAADAVARGPELRALLDHAAQLPQSTFESARRVTCRAAVDLPQILRQSDALLTPTCPLTALPIDAVVPARLATFVACANVARLPALSWPRRPFQAPGAQDLSPALSLQLIGRSGEDQRLLQIGACVQRMLLE